MTIGIFNCYYTYVPQKDKVCITCQECVPCKVIFLSREDIQYLLSLPFEPYHQVYVEANKLFPQ